MWHLSEEAAVHLPLMGPARRQVPAAFSFSFQHMSGHNKGFVWVD